MLPCLAGLPRRVWGPSIRCLPAQGLRGISGLHRAFMTHSGGLDAQILQPPTSSVQRSGSLSPLHPLYRDLDPSLADFGGYLLPLSFPFGILQAHFQARSRVLLVDTPYMERVVVNGRARVEFLDDLVICDVHAIPPGTMKRTLILNEFGGIDGDLVLTNEETHMTMTFTSSLRKGIMDKILPKARWMAEKNKKDVHVDEGMFADHTSFLLLGPLAALVLQRHGTGSGRESLSPMTCRSWEVEGYPCVVTRRTFCGIDGVEICARKDHALTIGELLLASPEVALGGLDVLEVLRVEAADPLYGHEFDHVTSPVEAGVESWIGKDKLAKGIYLGADVVNKHMQCTTMGRRLIGLASSEIVLQDFGDITNTKGTHIGHVTSGVFSPLRREFVAMAMVDREYQSTETSLNVSFSKFNVRGTATVVKIPFCAPPPVPDIL